MREFTGAYAMLSFSTEFPVGPESTPDAFIDAVKSWVLASPHTSFTAQGLSLLSLGAEKSVRAGKQLIEITGASNADDIAVSIRLTATEDNVDWISEVSYAGHREPWVSIRTYRDSAAPVARLPPAKKPIVVAALLDSLEGGWDGGIQVSRTARRLTSDEVELAANLISGDSGCYLPVVYVSANVDGSYWVNVDALARELCGMAHVIVEPDRYFSSRLRLEVEPAYGAAVGIYWPDGSGRRLIRPDWSLTNSDRRKSISKEVRQALLNRRPLTWCSWAAAQQLQSRLAIQALRASGSNEVDVYVATFDAELALKDAAIQAAEAEINRLSSEIRSSRQRSASTGVRIKVGSEQDYYPDEISSVIRDAAADALSRVQDNGRREHILKAVADNNPASNVPHERRENLKTLLRDYRSLNKEIRDGLTEMGFSISEDGKHVKLTYQGDDRYTFTIPKTGSDHRGGLNSVSDISKRLF
ncbi:hypothetical protein [Brevundimonas sp. FT23028]|uniref:hypothetical protein n=1 Tax=Brevundimonas sp. FT23028 TaxID=3393748 RepID=UPI003B5889EF